MFDLRKTLGSLFKSSQTDEAWFDEAFRPKIVRSKTGQERADSEVAKGANQGGKEG